MFNVGQYASYLWLIRPVDRRYSRHTQRAEAAHFRDEAALALSRLSLDNHGLKQDRKSDERRKFLA